MQITDSMRQDLKFFDEEQSKFREFIEEHPIQPDLVIYFWEGWIARARLDRYKPTYSPEQMAANFQAGMNTAHMEEDSTLSGTHADNPTVHKL
jgi:hypothetical protein